MEGTTAIDSSNATEGLTATDGNGDGLDGNDDGLDSSGDGLDDGGDSGLDGDGDGNCHTQRRRT